MSDHPFDEVIMKAIEYAAQGHGCYQKFTCRNCGQRLTMEEANKFWQEGTCDQPMCAGIVTNIKEQGCNYVLITNTHVKLGTPLTVTVCKPTTAP